MADTKTSRNSADWSDADVQQLKELADGNTPAGVMSIKLGRSEDAIRSKASLKGFRSRRRTGRRTATFPAGHCPYAVW